MFIKYLSGFIYFISYLRYQPLPVLNGHSINLKLSPYPLRKRMTGFLVQHHEHALIGIKRFLNGFNKLR